MGYSPDQFVCPIDDNRICSVCRGVLDHPVRISCCAGIFCEACVSVKEQCPCGSDLDPGCIQDAPDLQDAVEQLPVRCDYYLSGCQHIVVLKDLQGHLQVCRFRSEKCGNPGCGKTLQKERLKEHEETQCQFRPAGICQKGCRLVVMDTDLDSHDCIQALRAQVSYAEIQMAGLQSDVRYITTKCARRESVLLGKIASLHSQIQIQSEKFRLKTLEYKSQLERFLNKLVAEKVGDYVAGCTYYV